MAKILIGNVKGKNGRGISKIEKTASTGVVDTYTITYTDGTTSTYSLKNSDEIAIQRQIVPSASVEASSIASQSYTAGQYIVVSGILRKVTSAIAKGNTISDSNSTATTVGGELGSLSNFAYRKQTRICDGLMCYVEGGICIVSADFLNVSQKDTDVKLGDLPDGLIPLGHAGTDETGSEGTAYISHLNYRGADFIYGQLMVKNSGSIIAYVNDAGSTYSYFYGQLVFPVSRP